MGTLWLWRHVRSGSFSSFTISIHCYMHCCVHLQLTLTYNLQRSWAHIQIKRSYPDFIRELDQLQPDDVIWEPYTTPAITARAPLGLSAWCGANPGLWLTTTGLVYDIFVELHCPDRVMRLFGLRQAFHLPAPLHRVPRHEHG